MCNLAYLIPWLMFLSALCFATGSISAAWACYKAKKNVGIPPGTFWPIIIGIFANYSYLFFKYGFDPVITTSYLVEGSPWFIVVYYHYLGSNEHE